MLILNCMDCYSKRGAASVTDRTDQEFLGPIGTNPLHLHKISPHFSIVFCIFLFFWHFPQYPPSNAHVQNPNPCQFFPSDFFSDQRLTEELVKYGSLSSGAMEQEVSQTQWLPACRWYSTPSKTTTTKTTTIKTTTTQTITKTITKPWSKKAHRLNGYQHAVSTACLSLHHNDQPNFV